MKLFPLSGKRLSLLLHHSQVIARLPRRHHFEQTLEFVECICCGFHFCVRDGGIEVGQGSLGEFVSCFAEEGMDEVGAAEGPCDEGPDAFVCALGGELG